MKKSGLNIKIFIMAIAIVFAMGSLRGQNQTFTSSGTYTVPPNVTVIVVECWGGGGSGGGTTANTTRGGGGGAGGAYAKKTILVLPGGTFTVTVGGVRTGTQGAGATGNPSWFGTAATVYAEGGAGGAAPNGGTVAGGTGLSSSSIGDVVFAGGNGANGTSTLGGAGGGGAGSTGAGGSASGTTAGTGTSLDGGSGGAGRTTENNGLPGSNYGGGGGGAYLPDNTDHSGGDGAPGLVRVTWNSVSIPFYSNGSYTVPAGVTSMVVECWGGGSGGSNRTTNGTFTGGGGGGGAYASSIIDVIPGNTYNYVIGAGGAGSVDGGNSSFNSISVVAAGGTAGILNSTTGGAGGSALSSTGNIKYSGGTGGDGAASSGGGGGGAGINGTGGNATGATGGTGATDLGGTGGNGVSGSNNGIAGGVYGGGGSGASTNSNTNTNGGSGSNGLVVVSLPFFSSGNNDPSNLNSWWSNTNGTGFHPASFTANNQIFIIQNGNNYTTASGWTVSGRNTMVKIENGGVLQANHAISFSVNTIFRIESGGSYGHNHNINNNIFSGTNSFAAASTVNYMMSGDQIVAPLAFSNLTLSGSGVKTLTGLTTVNGNLTLSGTATATTEANFSIGGNLSIGDGTTFTVAGYTLIVTGTTTVGGGTSGTLAISSATGTKTFTGAVLINSGGAITESAAATLVFGSDVTNAGTLTENGAATVGFAGNFTNNGSYTASSGTHTFSGAARTIGGTSSISIQSATFSGTYTNNGTLIVGTALSGGGGLTQGATGILNIGGTSGITTLTATTAGNIVNYNGAAQTVKSTTYSNLTLSGSGIKIISGFTINGIISLEGTATTAGSTPVFGAGATLQYKGSTGQTTGVEFPATFSGSGGVIVNNAAGITLSGNRTISTILTMTQGNVITGTFQLTLSNGLVTSLVYNSGTIIGRFTRAVNTTLSTNYLFPVGTSGFYRPAVMNFSSISAGTNITAEFIATPAYGFAGYTDGLVTLNSIFTDGYWRFSSSGTPAVNYSLSLTAESFTSFLINANTRITGHDNTNSTWRALGTHGTLTGNVITRTGVTNLNTTSFDFTLASECSTVSMSYGFERDITIDYTKVSGGTDLYNFPVLVYLTGQNFLKSTPAGPIMSANGFDIIFTDDSHNKLDHQIESYNGTNGDLIAWVRIPTLSASSNTIIKILYGNSQVTANPSVATVWDSHYKGVWHLDNSSLNDFTTYNKSGTPYNTPTYPAGQISTSLGLNGTSQYVEVLNDPDINFAGNITVSAWVYMVTGGRDQKIASNQNNSSGGYKFGIYTNNKVEFEIRNSSNVPSLNRDVTGGTVLSTGQWYYLSGISSDVLDSIKTFVNGIPERPFKKTGTLGVASNTLVISKEPFSPSFYFAGRFDELRISDKVRSNGWLRTDYNNQVSPSTFYSVGTEVSLTDLPSASICDVPVTLPNGYPSGGSYSGNPYISGNLFTPPSAGTYSIVYTYNGACGPASVAKQIVITPVPVAPVAPNKEYCTGQIANLEATTGVNIKWYNSVGTLVSTANPYSTGLTVPGTYNFTVTQSVNGCESTPAAVTLAILSGITITTHPQPYSTCQGSNATFSVAASGINMTYQWQENGGNITNGGIYSGATTSTLTLTDPGIGKNGASYRCVISTTCGTTPVNSNAAILTVNPLPVATFSYAGTPYCPNASNPSPTFSGGGVAGTFSSTAGLVFVSTATGQINIAASTPGSYTVTNTIAASGGCSAVIATSPFSITSNLSWTGALNTDWNNTGNWSCNYIPTAMMSVQIPDVANKPVLSSGAVGQVRNLVIDNNSSLTISGRTLQISGTITNNGTLTATSGTVELNGTSAQVIGANLFSGNTISNLIINNNAGATLQGALSITGSLLISNGSLASNGNLTLASSALQTALIDGSGTGEITGNVTMQRYLPSNFGYKYMSSPFQSAAVSELGDDMNLGAAFPSVYRYDESRLSSGWVSYINPVSILNPMAGYSVNFLSSPIVPNTVDITGTVNNGPLSVTLSNNNRTYTKGLNLVGNPYPSPINWDAAGWTKTNIDNAIYFFTASLTDQYGGTYSSYVNGTSSDGIAGPIISSMQGFFIHVSDIPLPYPVTGTFGITNNVRVTSLSPTFFKSAKASPVPFVRITATFSDDPGSSDPAVIYFDENGTEDMDYMLDALKLFNTDLSIPNLYSVSTSSKKLSISALPLITGSLYQVPLGIKVNRSGTIIIKVKDVEDGLAAGGLFLSDAVTGLQQDLTVGNQYSIYLTNGEYLNRFWLNFGSLTTGLPENQRNEKMFTVYRSGGVLRVVIMRLAGEKGELVIHNILGQKVFNQNIHETGSYEFNPSINGGIYIVTFISGSERYSQKLFIGGR